MMRRAPVVAGQRCIEAKGRKLWLRWSEPPLLGVHRGPLALSQGSTVSSHRQKALRPSPSLSMRDQAPQPQQSVQWLPRPLVDQGRALHCSGHPEPRFSSDVTAEEDKSVC